MDFFRQDLRFAVRTLRKSPGFTLMAVLTLALGIGAATALYSVVHAVLLQPLPYPQPERIVQLWQVNQEGNQARVSDPNYADWVALSRSFAALAQYQVATTSVVGGDEPVRRPVAWVSRDFFRVIGVQPVVGRGFVAEEQQPGGAPAVLVSHSFWQEQLGGEPELTGRSLSFGEHTYTVVGVMPPGFEFPGGAMLWAARELQPLLASRTAHNWWVVGRLQGGVTLTQARQELAQISHELKRQHGDDTWMVDAAVVPLHEQLVGRVRPVLLVMLGAAGFLLLIAVANVSNLLLARMAGRRRELSVRVALGAGRWRLIQQMLAESLVLSVAAGLLGVLVARLALQALLAAEPGNLPRVDQIGISGGALAFGLAISLLAACVLGVLAALRASSADVRGGLRIGERTPSGSASSRRLQNGLVATQIALTLVLLVGAALLGRTMQQLLAVDLGFRTESVVAVNLAHSGVSGEPLGQLHHEIITALRVIPGVEEVGGSNRVPLTWGGADGTFIIQSHPAEIADFDAWGALAKISERTGYAGYRVASDGYFRALRIPLLRGRLFDERDVSGAPHVAVISESLARTRWPGEDPLGKLINFGNMDGDLRPMTIVGVVGDIRDHAIDAEPQPTVYASYRQRPGYTTDFNYVLTGRTDVASLSSAARRVAAEIVPNAPPRIQTIEEIVARPFAPRRFALVLLTAFGATALLLATLGIYGVTAYGVAQRTREFGIRMALGARQQSVVRLVVRQGAVLALVGVGIGLLASLAAARFVAHLLYGVTTTDAFAYLAVTTLLVAVALLACLVPARRATRVDPLIALRSE
jgi:putative ABC transport system permease protein